MILVDGIDGSGKTSFAGRLAETMRRAGAGVTVVHVDDFRRSVDWVAQAEDEAAAYWDRYFDLEAVAREARGAVEAGLAVVLEGIFTLRLPGLTAAPLVYLEVDFAMAAERIICRDTARGRTVEDVRHRIEARYFPAQRRYRGEFQPLDRAAIVIDNNDPSYPRPIRADWNGLPRAAAVACRHLMCEAGV